jgi:hypothetical protein
MHAKVNTLWGNMATKEKEIREKLKISETLGKIG